jgi:hypothetical protein
LGQHLIQNITSTATQYSSVYLNSYDSSTHIVIVVDILAITISSALIYVFDGNIIVKDIFIVNYDIINVTT